jgi:hypothetical protein
VCCRRPIVSCGVWPAGTGCGSKALICCGELSGGKPAGCTVLPDGSYLARIEANKHSKAAKTVKAPPALVGVTGYRVDGQPDAVRLITSLTDHEEYPAVGLAAFCARRWEIELVLDEIKTHQRGRPVLRPRTPDGVRQRSTRT